MRGEAEELENDPCLREQRKNRKFKNRLGLKLIEVQRTKTSARTCWLAQGHAQLSYKPQWKAVTTTTVITQKSIPTHLFHNHHASTPTSWI